MLSQGPERATPTEPGCVAAAGADDRGCDYSSAASMRPESAAGQRAALAHSQGPRWSVLRSGLCRALFPPCAVVGSWRRCLCALQMQALPAGHASVRYARQASLVVKTVYQCRQSGCRLVRSLFFCFVFIRIDDASAADAVARCTVGAWERPACACFSETVCLS